MSDFPLDPPTDEQLLAPIELKKYYVNYVPDGITTFEELDALVAAQQATNQVRELSWQYMAILENVMFDPTTEDLPSKITGLANEFGARIQRVLNGEEIIAKSADPAPSWLESSALEILKDKPQGALLIKQGQDGKHYAYCKPTNNFQDRSKDILTEKSHQEYVDFVTTHPQAMPALQLWHEDATTHVNKACWAAWADNSLHLVFELTPDEAARWETLGKSYDLAMSHRSYALDYSFKSDGGRIINKYRMYEASGLPRDKADNLFTDLSVIAKEEPMPFDADKRQFLVTAFGEEFVSKAEQQNLDQAATLRAQIVHKEATPDVAPPAPAYVTAEDLSALRGEMTEAVSAILARLPAPTPEPEVQKDLPPAPPMSILMAALTTYDPTNATPIDGRSPLAKAKPNETPAAPPPSNPIVGFVQSVVAPKPKESEGQ